MENLIVQVVAPARLHFGMFSFAVPGVRQFGGVGVMVRQPALRLTISSDQRLCVTGPLAERARHFARLAWRRMQSSREPPLRIEILAAPAAHSGLGSGTQLAMAVAAGLNSFCGAAPATAEALARRVDRGTRSAVGLHGFVHGGLIAESGKLAADEISPMVARVQFPRRWRFVLITPRDAVGIHGHEEREAFAHLPAVPAETTAALAREAFLRLIPAVATERFEDASDSLYRYGHLAGTCFASRQAGAYASRRLRRSVEVIRSLGVSGVGQSSWGPTLFALLPDSATARHFVDKLSRHPEAENTRIIITAAANRGAKIRVRQVA